MICVMENRIQKLTNKLILLLAVFSIAVGTGCDNTFDPLKENDQYVFSMYGAADLHGEFTKIRVMPIGDTLIPTDPEPNETQVTLIRNSTGEETVLNDSLSQLRFNTYVWNYLTSENLHANEEYTLLAETPDGDHSTASINLPSELPVPTIESYTPDIEEGVFSGTSEDPVVTIETRYLVQVITEFDCEPERELVFSHLDDVTVYQDGRYYLEVRNASAIARELGPTVEDFQINGRELVVISSGEDWPDTSDLSEEEIVLPDMVTNVEQGTGLVAGVAGRRVQITPRQEPC